MVGVWMGVYRSGYDWNGSEPEQQFSYHPLFMFIGLVFLYANGQCKCAQESYLLLLLLLAMN